MCQVGLQFGADDVGSILIEENVVYAAGVRNRTNEEELRRIISDAGYMPAQRDTLYRSYVSEETSAVVTEFRALPWNLSEGLSAARITAEFDFELFAPSGRSSGSDWN